MTAKPTILTAPFGQIDGQEVELFTLSNARGMRVSITNNGGIITSIHAPDRNGCFDDIVLGFNSAEAYAAGHPYFGCITGRYANRIAKGAFALDGVTYTLACNDGPNHLHGGIRGFDKRIWHAETAATPDGTALLLSYLSPDGEEGYPGTLRIQVAYTLTDANALRIEYTATTDRPTVVNLTNHTYFNLAGEASGRPILDHILQINAGSFTAIDKTCIPTAIAPLDGTPLDFRDPTAIGERIGAKHDQMLTGYDHNYVLNSSKNERPVLAATVFEPESGRMLRVWTTEPGIQFYSGNFLDGTVTGKGGVNYPHRSGFCLEPQLFPDSPNLSETIPGYTSARLDPGSVYTQTSIFGFS